MLQRHIGPTYLEHTQLEVVIRLYYTHNVILHLRRTRFFKENDVVSILHIFQMYFLNITVLALLSDLFRLTLFRQCCQRKS